jgi:hypothetical protein
MQKFNRLISESRNKYRHVPGYTKYSDYVDGVGKLFGDVAKEIKRQIGMVFGMDMDLDSLMESQRAIRYRKEMESLPIPAHERHDYLLLESLYDDYPVYVIDQHLAESLSNTDIPKDIPVDHLFQKRGIILLPDPGDDSGKLTTIVFGYSDVDKCIDVVGVSSRYSVPKMPIFGADTVGYSMPRSVFTIYPGVPFPVRGRIVSADYQDSLNIIYNVFLYLQSAPDDFEEVSMGATTSGRKGFGVQKQSRQRTPIMIGGKRYAKRKQQTPATNHASPISHWRRGHWRNQPHGSKENPSYKLVWIEPTLINADKTA